MESGLILLVVFLLGVLVLFPLWALIRILGLGRDQDAMARTVADLQTEVRLLREKLASRPDPGATLAADAQPARSASAAEPPIPPAGAPVAASPQPAIRSPASPPPAPVTIPPASPQPVRPTTPAVAPSISEQRTPVVVSPLHYPASPPPVSSAPETRTPEPRINWEQFMGVKLYAWLGGIAAFLGVVFFVKYSFEHNWIPPQVRVAIGFVFGIGLLIGGLRIPRARYAVTAQTLIGTGVVTLYGVTFACNSIYHFAFFTPLATGAVMALVTATAFLLAVRLDARVIAVLGILGGFVTPLLLRTGHDNPPGLFGYVALLDLGLIAVALHRRWNFLVPLGALGTGFWQVAWAVTFLEPTKAGTAVVVLLGFSALFVAAFLVSRRIAPDAAEDGARGEVPREIAGSAALMPFVAIGFAFAFLSWPATAARPGLIFTFALLADICLLALAWRDRPLAKLHLPAGLAVFALLAFWTGTALTGNLLPWALAYYLLYAALHTVFPLLLQRARPETTPAWWSHVFAPLALLLMFIPLFRLDSVSPLFWPFVLLVDLIAIAVAVVTASLAAVAAVLLLTIGATGVWILRGPTTADFTFPVLFVIAAFGAVFFAATAWLGRHLGSKDRPATGLESIFGDVRSQLPAVSGLLPFVLLILVTQQLPLANPSPVFGLALLLIALILGLAYVLKLEWLPACAMVGLAALEYAWHARRFAVPGADTALAWYSGFTVVFAAYPFAARRRFAALTGPWAVAALLPAVQFPLVYRSVLAAHPTHAMGLLPAAFAVIPLASLVGVLQAAKQDDRAHLNQLAWFGGVALLFITLVFPIQFERQWLTLGWALEGAALLWLFQRVPHSGLRVVGVLLLITSFVRLALNPAVLEYHARSDTSLLNWYLYSYGLVVAALFAGARLLAPPRHEIRGWNTVPLLDTLGTVLLFLLVNIEIADFFSRPGSPVLTFEFSGNFARDMTYTIAWALFALGLLLVGIARRLRAVRYAALALLGAALLKLFLHDLARLDSLYRIGALFGVAIVAIGASFAYQRFLPGNDKDSTAS